jgi:DNA modification methylase
VSVVLLRGDARHLPLPDESVDLIVTSPPYFGLRDYHDNGQSMAGQIGSEETPREYIAALLDCTREWMRVLKPTGSLFVNLGDKFSQRVQVRRSSHQPGMFPDKFPEFGETWAERSANGATRMPHQNVVDDGGTAVAEKSLIGLPWRYALACTDTLGLILRRDIIWAKPSGLPESVIDRCGTRHEYLFHLTKEPRYFSAIDEIREPHAEVSIKRAMPHRSAPAAGRRGAQIYNGQPEQTLSLNQMNHPLGKLPGSVWEVAAQPLIVPASLGLDHFAAFPLELPRRCILGWSPSGICTGCGEGRRPVVAGGRNGDGSKPHKAAQRVASFDWAAWKQSTPHVITGYACACTPYTDHPASDETATRRERAPEATRPQGTYGRKQAGEYDRVGPWREYHLDAWVAPPTRPAVVADPFGGTGSTALVADALGRTGLSFDLSADYCRLARWRTTDPAERAKALQVRKPPPVIDGQESLFEVGA